ncbi:hypothetical protein [Vagococcus lutrae]|uniref:hypothetical protein n=1 Tax=Vagococcus lutrae TaxID=81947 RepID=UPI0028914C49|nr:hypothetical protein [Vagococcus lutrae]MDT2805229.1 hypothetical protein [Vagococcus lutrae]
MSLNIDFGNLWDMISALSTAGAVILSMWIIRKENKSEFKIFLNSENIQREDENGFGLYSSRKIIKARAYNSGKNTVGISFTGFWLVKKKPFLKRIISRNNYEKQNEISTLDQLLKPLKMELIAPGQLTEEYAIEWDYLHEIASKYNESDKDLLFVVEFKDFYGKRYYATMILK